MPKIDASTTAVELLTLPAGSRRKPFSILNNSTAKLYIDFGSAPTTDDAAIVLQPEQVYFSEDFMAGRFAGEQVVYGIWSAENGSANVREY